ncbi:hypothetical protein D3C85_1739530 [compost metagenome]
MTEGEEGQAGAALVCPGHRATDDKGLRREAFLGGALDVGRFRRVVEFFVVGFAPADDVVLLGLRQSFETIQVVAPQLEGGKA